MINKLKKINKEKLVSVLKVSMLLNVMLISFVLGGLILKPKHHFPRFHDHKHLIPINVIREHRKVIKQYKQDLITALKEEPFNKEKVESAMAKLDKEMVIVKDMMNQAILKGAAKVSAEERLKMLPPPLRLRTGGKSRYELPMPPPPPPHEEGSLKQEKI